MSACPVCHGSNLAKNFDIHREIQGKLYDYAIQSCNQCHFMWAEGPDDLELMDKIFDPNFHASSQQKGPAIWTGQDAQIQQFPILRNAQRRVEKLRSWGMKGPVLDIGSGRGYFVKFASQAFEAEGVELNKGNESFAKDLGIRQHFGDFFTINLKASHYGTLTMWDVLAGFSSPQRALKRINELLVPGGHLIFTVPMADSLAAKILGRRWPFMIPPVNMSFFSNRSLQILAEESGFEILRQERESKNVSLDFLWIKARESLLGLKDRPAPSRFLSQFSVPLNTGDILTVVARKKG